jgi:PAS domain S-box-containing protein
MDLLAPDRLADFSAGLLVANSRLPIVTMDVALCCLTWNPAMEALTGLRAEKVKGWHIPDAFPVLRMTGGLKRLEAALRGETTTHRRELFACVASGYYAVQTIQRRPMRDGHGSVIGVVSIVVASRRVKPFDLMDDDVVRVLEAQEAI